ncbi:A24 family peptidase [Sphingomonas sp. LHG3406-1]|uniref:prepilin peptidase n=1 Tax=Sphingomonas sp. LHG3406-1 TaxID=2804617 RepID=UPI0026064D1C|nr:A24 family peptidase [Sphingomonas sp. LHG3406-1]
MTPLLAVPAGLLLGAIVGSFLATLCLRWPEGRSVGGRSQCDGCGRQLGARDLVPLLSAALAGGRARCCGARIDPLHRHVEWAAALIGALSLWIAPSPAGLALALFGWMLLPLLVLDLRHFWLPDRLTILLGLTGLAGGSLLDLASLERRLIGAVAAGALLFLIGLIYRLTRRREGLGAGDPKLLAAIALWVGPELTVLTLLGGALLGLAFALRHRHSATTALPFGAFLCLAAWPVAAFVMTGVAWRP